MRFKLDENLGRRGQEFLRKELCSDVCTVSEQEIEGISDQSLIDRCHREKRCLITLDLDFANPVRFTPGDYSGIVVLRLPARPTLPDMIEALQVFVMAGRDKNLCGKLWIVAKGQVREYQG